MKRSVLFLICFVQSVLMLSGCSSTGEDDPLATAGGFCQLWAENACTDTIVTQCAAPSTEQCQVAQTEVCLDRMSKSYSGQGAQACLQFIRDSYRDQSLDRKERDAFTSLGAPCDLLLSGSGKAGNACSKTADCATNDGLLCIKRYGESEGQCHVPTEVGGGGRCADADSICIEGQYCNGANCVAKSEDGEPCSDSVPCADSARCVFEQDETEGLCEPRMLNGESCKKDDDCASALCDRNSDETEGTCLTGLSLSVRVEFCDDFR